MIVQAGKLTKTEHAFLQALAASAEKKDTDKERVFFKTVFDVKKTGDEMINKIMNYELYDLLKSNPNYKYDRFEIVEEEQGARTYKITLVKA